MNLYIHTQDTAGTVMTSMIAATNSGADVLDATMDAMSSLTYQPLLGGIVSAVRSTNIDSGFDTNVLGDLNIYM